MSLARAEPASPRISVAILAMGGQGGGVLADWIVALAEAQGYAAQSTSVPGVAQRTGATIYYIEMAPTRDGKAPVFALMPTPGDVDVVMAAELMEAGRSVLRGLVTPDRTTLIASTHRAFAVVEKQAPGDGGADPAVVSVATEFAAKRVVAFDMEATAKANGSVISATMLGALAATGALPFPRAAFEATIRAGGTGVEASLRAFAAAHAQTESNPVEPIRRYPQKAYPTLPRALARAELYGVAERIAALPEPLRPMLQAGALKLVDYLDPAYAVEYLDRIEKLCELDRAAGGQAQGFGFTHAAAKHLANAMAYDDVARVADLKLRASRRARVRAEVGARAGALVATTEYFHPRVEELCGALPRAWGERIEARPWLTAGLRKIVDHGRRIRPDTISGYLTLAAVARLGPKRRGSLRHAREAAHIEAWLLTATEALRVNYAVGVAVLNCRRLVKGYSDTHTRGLSKFDRVLAAVPALATRQDGAQWLDRLIRAALADEAGVALHGVLQTVASL